MQKGGQTDGTLAVNAPGGEPALAQDDPVGTLPALAAQVQSG